MPEKPDIAVKRAYLPPSEDDGTRILVDRLWPRGMTREKLAAIWLKEVAPSDGLRKWFHADPSRWAEFVIRYRAELDANPQALAALRPYLGQGRITLIYGARSQTQNHGLVLRDYLLEKQMETGSSQLQRETQER